MLCFIACWISGTSKSARFHLPEYYNRVITLGAQIQFKGTIK